MCERCMELENKIGQLEDDMDRLVEANEELEHLFTLRHAADIRALERWRRVSPLQRELVQPDHADMVVFLMEELEKAKRD